MFTTTQTLIINWAERIKKGTTSLLNETLTD